MSDAVFAIIVTYNRQALLRECLDAVLSQSLPPAAVIVVNNASSDDTTQMLETEYADRVTRLHMSHNVGGGGGFCQGMKWAYDNGADWLWLMDDDGVPAHDSLAAMMEPANTDAFAVMNPLVVCRDNAAMLSFGLAIDGEVTKSVPVVVEHAGSSQVLPEHVNPFNGTLVSRAAVEKIGYPRGEMFIWGDEVDYIYRLQKSGLPFATIINSVHRHPPATGRRINLGPFGTVDTKPLDRVGIAARNMGYIYRMHRGLKLRFLKPVVMSLYYLSQGSFRGCYDFIRYYVDGYLDTYRLAPSRSSLLEQGQQFHLCPVSAPTARVTEAA